MNFISAEDVNYLAQQPTEKLNIIISQMTMLMNSNCEKREAIESQNWFQRMWKTVTGKNRTTKQEIQANYEKLSAYMAEAVAELYDRGCIDHRIVMSLGVQLNELCAEQLKIKQMMGAFVIKLNEKIDSVDNFNMLVKEIDQGVYSDDYPISAICRVTSQFDGRILGDTRKLEIIRRSLVNQNILTGDEIPLADYLMDIMALPEEKAGALYLELGTERKSFLSAVFMETIEKYHFLPDMEKKMKNKRAVADEIIHSHNLDESVGLSVNEIYDDLLGNKINPSDFLLTDSADYNENDVPENEKEAFEFYMHYAEMGNARAQFEVGCCYFGDGVEEDCEEAFKWFMKAAEQGFAKAQFVVGIYYDCGKVVVQDDNEAFKWYIKAAEQGFAGAQYEIGECYYNGCGVAQNYDEAFKWYMKSAEQGCADALNSVGYCYDNGYGVNTDKNEAFKWFMKAAEQGNDVAQRKIGNCYCYGEGVAQNYDEAFKWYMKAAEQGYADAQNSVGYCYGNGYGVNMDKNEAFKWYMKAAEQGNDVAQYNVGLFYHYGRGNVSINHEKAKEWLRKSAAQGYEEAKTNLRDWYGETL